MGLCGGYQMLGKKIDDPHGIEGPARSADGLGFLDVETKLSTAKTLSVVTASSVGFGASVSGYEIHMGETRGPDLSRPVLEIDGRPEGASSANGQIIGSYVHGIFADNFFRKAFLENLADRQGRVINFGEVDFAGNVDAVLNRLADHIAEHLDMDAIAGMAGL